MTRWTDFLDPDGPDGAYLPWKRVEARVGISRTTAWRLQRSGDFPRPYVVSPGRVAYKESEVEAWKASRGHRAPSLADRARKPPPARSLGEAPAPPVADLAFGPVDVPTRPTPAAACEQPPMHPRPLASPSRKRGDSRQITFDF